MTNQNTLGMVEKLTTEQKNFSKSKYKTIPKTHTLNDIIHKTYKSNSKIICL